MCFSAAVFNSKVKPKLLKGTRVHTPTHTYMGLQKQGENTVSPTAICDKRCGKVVLSMQNQDIQQARVATHRLCSVEHRFCRSSSCPKDLLRRVSCHVPDLFEWFVLSDVWRHTCCKYVGRSLTAISWCVQETSSSLCLTCLIQEYIHTNNVKIIYPLAFGLPPPCR